ncbi:metal homeostatis protein bsd2 [Trichodelitschia bisporula]|uniref:Metal homeostatis protein bsd2 n=1 Tax=Trichodelitschia bisporula TaxID=703511 RepID=A0A6G1HV11_9PEZI|nr:metal homeostatis protein bsd2 [Trichodelitschia bisporula]
MSGNQRYERVAAHDADDHIEGPRQPFPIPNSPPPSFHSRASSPTARRLLASQNAQSSDAEQTLADTFDSPSDEDDSEDEDADSSDDRQRLMHTAGSERSSSHQTETVETVPRPIERRVTQLPVFSSTQIYGAGNANDGVFANLSAKPTRGEELDEKPPSYEQAAADATPPYWETTILAPGMVSDEVYVDGLPVGSIFSFIWNAMISMSFQIVGFLLTYLLHTTHAAKNGSRAGLGITLVQFGFQMKSPITQDPAGDNFGGAPADPNSRDFDPTRGPDGESVAEMASTGTISSSDWLAYIMMIMGWFILIKSLSDFLRARRHEQLVLQSPDRGLGVAVVAEGERPESSV